VVITLLYLTNSWNKYYCSKFKKNSTLVYIYKMEVAFEIYFKFEFDIIHSIGQSSAGDILIPVFCHKRCHAGLIKLALRNRSGTFRNASLWNTPKDMHRSYLAECCSCNAQETIQHLFFDCPVSRLVWSTVSITFDIRKPRSINDFFGVWLRDFHYKQRNRVLLGVAAVC
jgi:hypothetical protein